MMSLVREFYHSQWFLIVMITLAIWVFVSSETIIMYTMKQARGDDNENDFGLCLNYHVKKACARVDAAQNITHDLEGRLMIWNSLNCSVRDICNPVNCDPNDESFNVTGFCDPDWNGATEDPCFATKELAESYMKLMGDNNQTGSIHYPCPPFEFPHGDESGK